MAMNTVPRFLDLVRWNGVLIQPADTTALKTLWTAPTNGSKIVAINAVSDDTATKVQQLWISKGGTDYLIGTKTIPITAGFVTGTPAFNWFDGVQIPAIAIDADGQRYLFLESGCELKVGLTATATAAKTHYVTAFGMDF